MGFLRPADAWRRRYAVAALPVLLGFAGCDNTIPVDPATPAVYRFSSGDVDSLIVPEFWVLGSGEYRGIQASLSFPDDVTAAIRSGRIPGPVVWLQIYPPGATEPSSELFLQDDGGAVELPPDPAYLGSRSGDLIPGDFTFTVRINSQFADVEGEWNFEFLFQREDDINLPSAAVLDDGHSPSIVVVVNVAQNEPPQFGEFILPDSLHAGFGPQQWTIQVSDPNEPSGDEVVEVGVKLREGVTVRREFLFARRDAETWGFDADSTFAVGLPTSQYTMSFTATDQFEQESAAFEHELWIENLAPELLHLVAPDTVQQPEPDSPPNIYSFLLTVLDHAGQGDIESVYYTVLDPTGNYFESPDYVFRDDGEGEDDIAGDAIWTHGFQVTQSVSNFGSYTFTFYARDRAGQLSVAIEHLIELISSPEPQP